MSTNKRVKIARKELGLSMEQFGERLGVTKATISRIESDNRPLTDRMAKAICREFNIDYFWLTEGTGDMFIEFPNVAIDMICEDYNLDTFDRVLLETYLEANTEKRKTIKEFFTNVCKKIDEV